MQKTGESGQMVLEKVNGPFLMHINVKLCKKINERVQTFRFSVFTMGRQELFAKNAEN